jgi:hypothetical protein
MILKLRLTLLVWLAILSFNVTMYEASAQAPSQSGTVFYFHYRTQVYRNENGSVAVLEEANFTLPSTFSPQVVEVDAAIRNATIIFFGTAWIGSVAWITQPIIQPQTISGPISFTVWLSSDDSAPSFSGIGAGVAVLDQQDNVIGSYVYSYSYSRGKILTSTPTPYQFTVNFDRQVGQGQKLLFAVGVGSTSLGWRMKVYFDGQQYPSRAQLPSSVTVVPEFSQPPALLILAAVSLLSLTKVIFARRNRKLRAVWSVRT